MSGREIQWCIGNDTFDMLQGESFTVTENGMVTFSNKNAWTWLYTGTYIKSTGTATPAAITNTLEKVDIPVEKIWEDNNNAAGIRPDSITVKLLLTVLWCRIKLQKAKRRSL